jgi:cytochrome c oxidase subunit 2
MDSRTAARRLTATALVLLAIVSLGSQLSTRGALAQSPAAATPATGNVERGKKLFTATCATCHGEKGGGKKEFNSPQLARQERWYIVAQLQKFRAGLRGTDAKDTGGSMMRPMAQALPDEQSLLDVAAYVTTLQPPPPTPEVKGDVAAGKTHFTTVCAACHGANARGKPELKTPALVGQNDWYVVAQLQKFKAGTRGANPKDITGLQMKGMAATLADDDAVRNVASYIATLAK